MVDVQFGCGTPIRFNKDGRRVGDNRDSYLDTIPFADRAADIARDERAKTAVRTIAKVVVQPTMNARWGKEGLAQELDRLQVLINEARTAVEAI
jgi:hypothetical protein